MKFSDLEEAALELNGLYEELEVKRWGRVWTTQELALGFMGDVGDLAKLIQAHAGVRTIENHQAKIGHELSDCLWSIMVLAKSAASISRRSSSRTPARFPSMCQASSRGGGSRLTVRPSRRFFAARLRPHRGQFCL